MNDDKSLIALAEVVKYEHMVKIKEWPKKNAQLEAENAELKSRLEDPLKKAGIDLAESLEWFFLNEIEDDGNLEELSDDEKAKFLKESRSWIIDDIHAMLDEYLAQGQWNDSLMASYEAVISERD